MQRFITLTILIMAITLGGCVAKSQLVEKTNEANKLSTELADLKVQHKDLSADFAQLQSENADLKNSNTALNEDIKRAGADIDRLEAVISDRDAETGKAMAEMREEIDRLMTSNRELEQAVQMERIAKLARIAQMQSTYNELVGKMESEIKRGEITISELKGRLTVNMVNRILFSSGSAEIKEEGITVLQRVAEVVKDVKGKNIRVEGHTDNVAISSRLKDKFESNWELSAARAATVVRALRDADIPGERLSAVGFGPFRPVADNSTAEGRAQNRRIQIVLVPQSPQEVKEQE